jgi:hypothetical protein
MTAQLETCANCCATIDRLERAFIWQGETICATCYGRLSGGAGTAPAAPPVFADVQQPTAHRFMYGSVVLTPTQLQMGATVYPLRNIASVSSGGNVYRGARPGLIVAAFGLVVLVVGLATHSQREAELEELKAYRNGEAYQQLQAAVAWSAGLVVVGIAVTGAAP